MLDYSMAFFWLCEFWWETSRGCKFVPALCLCSATEAPFSNFGGEVLNFGRSSSFLNELGDTYQALRYIYLSFYLNSEAEICFLLALLLIVHILMHNNKYILYNRSCPESVVRYLFLKKLNKAVTILSFSPIKQQYILYVLDNFYYLQAPTFSHKKQSSYNTKKKGLTLISE